MAEQLSNRLRKDSEESQKSRVLQILALGQGNGTQGWNFCYERAVWQWLGGGMQESGKKNQLLDGDPNPKEAFATCPPMASMIQGWPTSSFLAHKVFSI